MRDWADFHVATEGYAIAVAMVPRGVGAVTAIGLNEITLHSQFGCKFGLVMAMHLVDQIVADATARLALTGMPKYARVRQTNDGVNDYQLNVVGGESTAGNWSTIARVTSGSWCNENKVRGTGFVYARGGGGWIDTTKSVYGVAMLNYGASEGGPSGNTIWGMDVEQPSKTGQSECLQAVIECGNANIIYARNDTPSLYGVHRCWARTDATHATVDGIEPYCNEFRVARAGRRDMLVANRLDRSNGRANRVLETPSDHTYTKEFSVPSLFEDATFSGTGFVYWKQSSAVVYGGTVSDNTTYNAGTNTGVKFNSSDRSFDMDFSYGWGLLVTLPENTAGDAQLEIEGLVSPGGGCRASFVAYSPSIPTAFLDTTARSRSPIRYLQGGMFADGGIGWWKTGGNVAEPMIFGFEPWVKRVLIRLTGTGMLGYSARLSYAPGGSIGPAPVPTPRGRWVAAAKPERGIFRAPAEFLFADQTGANKGFRLNKTPASGEWWAVTQTGGLPGSPVLWQWASDAANTVKQWNGATWDTIATGVNLAVPADFVSYT